VGALLFIPDGGETAAPGAPEHLPLTKGEVASILRDLKRAPLGMQRGEERDFRMTPIYDVMSAEPNLQAGQVRRNEYKLAMSVGDRRNYPIYNIHPRHFLQSAEVAGLPDGEVEAMFEDLDAELESALQRTVAAMPADFPAEVSGSIADGMRTRVLQWRDYREVSPI
jgi:hypothetical protein